MCGSIVLYTGVEEGVKAKETCSKAALSSSVTKTARMQQ